LDDAGAKSANRGESIETEQLPLLGEAGIKCKVSESR
jgi:hypothetical protein